MGTASTQSRVRTRAIAAAVLLIVTAAVVAMVIPTGPGRTNDNGQSSFRSVILEVKSAERNRGVLVIITWSVAGPVEIHPQGAELNPMITTRTTEWSVNRTAAVGSAGWLRVGLRPGVEQRFTCKVIVGGKVLLETGPVFTCSKAFTVE